jgi:hypothetical protein
MAHLVLFLDTSQFQLAVTNQFGDRLSTAVNVAAPIVAVELIRLFEPLRIQSTAVSKALLAARSLRVLASVSSIRPAEPDFDQSAAGAGPLALGSVSIALPDGLDLV